MHRQVLGALMAALAGTVAAAVPQAESGPARVIVKYRAGTNASSQSIRTASPSGDGLAVRQALTMGRRHGLTLVDGQTIAPRTQVLMAQGMSSAALVAKLAADPEVEAVEIDRRMRRHGVPNDPLYLSSASPVAGQWYLRPPTRTLVSATNVEAAWDITVGQPGVVVAVLDTGVFKEHPDLAGKLLPGYDFIAEVNTANDGDGPDSDPSDPGDWVSQSDIDTRLVASTCAIESSSWHGTQMAGIIGAATGNNVGMAGVGRGVMVLPVRVLGKCGGFVSDITAGMRWAAGLEVNGVPRNPNPARVISMSLGGEGACSSAYQDAVNAVQAVGAVVVASAGNEGLAVDMPANCRGVIAVGGLRHTGSKSGFSNLGPEVALGAPGGNCVNPAGEECLYPILGTMNSGTEGPGSATYTDGLRQPAFGTSYSVPQVSGTVALMLSATASLTPEQVVLLLKRTARRFSQATPDTTLRACRAPSAVAQGECLCTTSTCGAGMLDARAAVFAATQPIPAEDSGGGALGFGWLLGLASATGMLAWLRRQRGAAD